MFADLDRGDQGSADLDAIATAAAVSGGGCDAMVTAWSVMDEAESSY